MDPKARLQHTLINFATVDSMCQLAVNSANLLKQKSIGLITEFLLEHRKLIIALFDGSRITNMRNKAIKLSQIRSAEGATDLVEVVSYDCNVAIYAIKTLEILGDFIHTAQIINAEISTCDIWRSKLTENIRVSVNGFKSAKISLEEMLQHATELCDFSVADGKHTDEKTFETIRANVAEVVDEIDDFGQTLIDEIQNPDELFKRCVNGRIATFILNYSGILQSFRTNAVIETFKQKNRDQHSVTTNDIFHIATAVLTIQNSLITMLKDISTTKTFCTTYQTRNEETIAWRLQILQNIETTRLVLMYYKLRWRMIYFVTGRIREHYCNEKPYPRNFEQYLV